MMWSTDYPHHGNDWPYSRKVIAETMAALPADGARPDRGRQRGSHLRSGGLRTHARRRPDPRVRGRPRGRAARHVRRAPAGQVQGRWRRGSCADRGRRRRLALRGPGAAQHRAQRGGRQAARGVRHRADVVRRDAPGLLRHPRARRATWTPTASSARCASRASPSSAASCSAAPRTRTVALAMVQAYNDWHIDEWCGTYPGRFIPLSIPPIWDPELMADEVRRVAAKGCRAVTFSENPEKLGWPSFHSDHWDPFWQACQRRGHRRVPAHRLVVAAGHHLDRGADQRDDHAAADEHRAGRGRHPLVAGADRVPRRALRPVARAASAGSRTSSSGATTSTSTTSRGPARTCRCCPSELFRERFITCFIDDAVGRQEPPRRRHRQDHLGVRLPALRLDVARLARAAGRARSTACPTTRSTRSPTSTPCGSSTTTRSRVIPREQCTVGALRAQATGVDTSPKPVGQAGRAPRHAGAHHRPRRQHQPLQEIRVVRPRKLGICARRSDGF